ncbi:cilia- and flagella-associated protein 91-like [Bombyx mandarina]|uniref:Cilia- and flagella-associated protein 91 n=1 Tax=Bombyx mandarina TaxID=7092 RepID=A0A6J2JMM0_BOMMA|nr:cilia- and flagella-associated protein 91-like [Bombyx mandarina]
MRHARIWSEVAEQGKFPRWMKKRDAIITDVETKDWIFRETEIDELQEIRLELLHRMQMANRQKQTSRTGTKLARLWDAKKREMDKKIEGIRRTRDRELRKLSAVHSSGGRAGLVAALRASRGAGSARAEAVDPSSDAHAPLARHGYQARRRHAEITYDPDLLSLEDHEELSKPPSWLDKCGQDLTRTCSGHHLPRDATQLCQRETKWSESFLESLHNDLKKARLGAGSQSAGPLRVLRPRVTNASPRPPTPEVEAVDDTEEENHQAALMLQRVLRGRAVQTLMYEGRTRAAELTEELKTTHGLQKEDKSRIAREETKAREYNIFKMEREQREEAVTALVDELCGGAVSTALDFLEKELRRLREERRQHAYILIALRDKTMREAAEAGRRQKEEHRRMEHDQMFKQILGVTQETVDDYLLEIVSGGVELAAERDALRRAQANADKIDADFAENESISTAEQNELVAELVHQFLLPHAHRTAARHRIAATQQARMEAARSTIFGLIDEPDKTELQCIKCGTPLDERCRCKICPISLAPAERPARDDPRWKHTRSRPRVEPKSLSERYPVHHELRCMLNVLVDEAVLGSRDTRRARVALRSEWGRSLRERTEATIDAVEMIDTAISRATGEVPVPLKKREYHHYMKRIIGDALGRTEPYHKSPCPLELPSEVRRRAEEEARLGDSTCRCEDDGKSAIQLDDEKHLLPSELRALEDLRRCKCDADSITTATHDQCSTEDFETNVEGEDDETDLI